MVEKHNLGFPEPIDIYFDNKTEKDNVLKSYQFLKFTAPDDLKDKLGNDPEFREDHEVIPLQAADLYAGWIKKSHIEGVNLRESSPFPWKSEPIKVLYVYLSEQFLREEFTSMFEEANMKSFHEYLELERRQFMESMGYEFHSMDAIFYSQSYS